MANIDLDNEKTFNKYILQWRDYILKASEAMKNGNDEEYESCMNKANEAYETYKEDSRLNYECKNFGISNFIFEDALPKIFKKNKKAVKEFIQTIKEDKNLKSEFLFYKSLQNYNKDLDVKEYINEALDLALNNIDLKTVGASNEKLSNIISKYNLRPSEVISEASERLYESCDYLLTHKKSLLNLAKFNSNIKEVSSYIENNINENTDKSKGITDIASFNDKYSKILNKEEKKFVKQIIESKENNDTEKQETLFNKMKNECLELMSEMKKNATDEDKDGLEAIEEQIRNKQFNSNTIVEDIAKFLEIKDVLKS